MDQTKKLCICVDNADDGEKREQKSLKDYVQLEWWECGSSELVHSTDWALKASQMGKRAICVQMDYI